jgi:hypothetical protein
MMRIISPHVFEVVVLTGNAHAFLGIDRSFIRTLIGAQKNILELDHAGVREKQCLITARHQGR